MTRDCLKDARRARGLTALSLATITGIREEKIYQVERGRYAPTHDEAVLWAVTLGIPMEVAFPELCTKGAAQ